MSILIAYKKDNTIFMGTDTRLIINERKTNKLCKCDYKIQKMDNEMLVGIAGDRIVRQTCFAFSEIFTLDKNNNLTRKHIFTQIIPKLIKLLTEHDLLSSKNNQPPKINAEILLAYKSELFEICSNFTICKYEDYQAVGNISNYVQFILANTNKNHDVNQRIIKALDVASKHSQHVSRPYVLIDTKNQDYKLIEE